MPRRGGLREEQAKVKPRTNGRKMRKIENESDLDQATLQWKKDYAVFLKAGDHSYRYISDVLGVTTSMVKNWFQDDELRQRVVEVQADMIDGALKLLKRYSIEAVELLMTVARNANSVGDYSDAIKAVEGVLDRAGLSKVNKSESTVTKEDRHIHDTTEGFFDKFESLPHETQAKIADLMGEVEQLVTSAKGTE